VTALSDSAAGCPSGVDADPGALHPHGVRLRHRFQAGHRLPQLAGQCQSLHGHSWDSGVTVTAAGLTLERTVVEFGAFKAGLRGWIDTHLDHGVMLAAADPLVPVLTAEGTKVFRFGAAAGLSAAEELAADLRYPTVEEVAALLCRVAEQVLAGVPHARQARVGLVEVEETDVNRAWYAPTYPAPGADAPLRRPSGAVIG
jgi:6-pyruvoyltetrahydropterin/6-carboxytetrahydropterin synthase